MVSGESRYYKGGEWNISQTVGLLRATKAMASGVLVSIFSIFWSPSRTLCTDSSLPFSETANGLPPSVVAWARARGASWGHSSDRNIPYVYHDGNFMTMFAKTGSAQILRREAV